MNIAICDDCLEYINTMEKYLEDMNVKCFDYDVFFAFGYGNESNGRNSDC